MNPSASWPQWIETTAESLCSCSSLVFQGCNREIAWHLDQCQFTLDKCWKEMVIENTTSWQSQHLSTACLMPYTCVTMVVCTVYSLCLQNKQPTDSLHWMLYRKGLCTFWSSVCTRDAHIIMQWMQESIPLVKLIQMMTFLLISTWMMTFLNTWLFNRNLQKRMLHSEMTEINQFNMVFCLNIKIHCHQTSSWHWQNSSHTCLYWQMHSTRFLSSCIIHDDIHYYLLKYSFQNKHRSQSLMILLIGELIKELMNMIWIMNK